MNWDSLIPQLANFGVQLNETKVTRLKQADPVQLKGLLTALFEIDTSPVPQRNGGSSSLLKLD